VEIRQRPASTCRQFLAPISWGVASVCSRANNRWLIVGSWAAQGFEVIKGLDEVGTGEQVDLAGGHLVERGTQPRHRGLQIDSRHNSNIHGAPRVFVGAFALFRACFGCDSTRSASWV
jgi:hypothetical protein